MKPGFESVLSKHPQLHTWKLHKTIRSILQYCKVPGMLFLCTAFIRVTEWTVNKMLDLCQRDCINMQSQDSSTFTCPWNVNQNDSATLQV